MKYDDSTIDRLFKMLRTNDYCKKDIQAAIKALNDASDLYLQLDTTLHVYRYDEDGKLYDAGDENSGMEEYLTPRFADRQLDVLVNQIKKDNEWARRNGLQPSSTPASSNIAWSTLNLRWASEEEVMRQGVFYLDYGERVNFGEADLVDADDDPATQKAIEIAEASN